MLEQLKVSLNQNEVTIKIKLDAMKQYLEETQNEMTIIDAFQCFPEFESLVKNLDLTNEGKKLIEVIMGDSSNPFEYRRAISNLISKIEYTYNCELQEITLIELMFLVRFAHMYLGESQSIGVCEIDEAVKEINFNKKDIFIYRYVQDELYYDGFIIEGKYDGDCYKQAQRLIKKGFASEVRFLEKGKQITCTSASSRNGSGTAEVHITIAKYEDNSATSSYPDNYFAFRTFVELPVLLGIKEMTTLTEIMEYMLSITTETTKEVITETSIDSEYENFVNDGEALPF